MEDITLRNIYQYTESNLNEYLSQVDPDPLRYDTLGKKRYMAIYYLRQEDRLFEDFDTLSKFLADGILIYNDYESLVNYIRNSDIQYQVQIMNDKRLRILKNIDDYFEKVHDYRRKEKLLLEAIEDGSVTNDNVIPEVNALDNILLNRQFFAFENDLFTDEFPYEGTKNYGNKMYPEDIQRWIDGYSYNGQDPAINNAIRTKEVNNDNITDQLLQYRSIIQSRNNFADKNNLDRSDKSINRWLEGGSFIPSEWSISKDIIDKFNLLGGLINNYCGSEDDNYELIQNYLDSLDSYLFKPDLGTARYSKDEYCFILSELKKRYDLIESEELFGHIKNA